MWLLLALTAAPAQLPYSPSLDPSSLDKTIDPCVDFYHYSCGNWIARNPIPADKARWDVYGKLENDDWVFLRGLLEDAAASGPRDPVTQKIGDFYAACMDVQAVESQGAAPLRATLDAIQNLHSLGELTPLLARIHLDTPGLLFAVAPNPDLDDSTRMQTNLDQSGLGLPDRDYYMKADKKSAEIRARYRGHIAATLALLGDETALAKGEAEQVFAIETALARASLSPVERRDPYALKHAFGLAALTPLTPTIAWPRYFAALGAPAFTRVNVRTPGFFRGLERELRNRPLSAWKSYLRFHLANMWAEYLNHGFVAENFEFYKHFLRGVAEPQPRWKTCVQQVDGGLGEALGRAYVSRVFSPQLRQATLAMTERIEAVMKRRLEARPWMSAATKLAALAKLAGLRNKIGYPEVWRDYSAVTVLPHDYAGNLRAVDAFEVRRQLDKIGKPVDRAEWSMTPPTVNAGYDPQMNDITFPAAVLQPPLYDSTLDDAPNYGNTGATIGHELTHAFDDEGRQFDATGNLRDWWTAQDGKEFERRTQCVADQYARYVVVDDIHINPKLTLGEDVADLGGTVLAYEAWKDATRGQTLAARDGLSPEQRFFVGYAQWACGSERAEVSRVEAQTDPHSPERARVNGVVVNMPEFAEAFSCKAGQAMVKAKKDVCEIW